MSYHPRLNRKSSSQSSSKKKSSIFAKRPFLSEEKRIEEQEKLQRYSAEEIQQRLDQAALSYLDRDEDTPEEKNNAGETTEVNASQTTEAVQAKCDGCEAKTETEEDKQPIQNKLTVGAPDDPYEEEANATAAKVVRMINSPATSESAQNKEDGEENLEIQTKVMPKGGNGGGEVDEQVEKGINQSLGSGPGIDDGIKGPMEDAFGADFSKVTIHTDGNADKLNKSLNSRAFATGQDIFFKQGEYNPGNRQGQELLAHELTHVVQQNGAALRQKKKQPENSRVSLKEIPILNGITPKSTVLTHLQSLRSNANYDTSIYRKEIEKFNREKSPEKIAASQGKVVQAINSPTTKDSVQNKEDIGGNNEIQTTVMRKGSESRGEVDGQTEKIIDSQTNIYLADAGVLSIPLGIGIILVVVGAYGIIVQWKDITGTITEIAEIAIDWGSDLASDIADSIINALVQAGIAAQEFLERYHDLIEDLVEDIIESKKKKRKWGCTDVRCNVYQVIPGAECPDRVIGNTAYIYSSYQEACRAAQRNANSKVPEGCNKRHCNCNTKCKQL